ncbi:MAG: hypothetical protein Q9208_004755 [Pyrenodesmia sp. 3 TL-2023]
MKRQHILTWLQAVTIYTSIAQCVLDLTPPPNPQLATVQDLLVADPRRNITCLGDHSDIGWNLREQAYDNRTMQQLCADPLYGGLDSSPNLRGYCQSNDVFFGPLDLLRPPGTRGRRDYPNTRRAPFQTRIFAHNANPGQHPHFLYDLSTTVSILVSNQIRCDGPLPGFQLPHPFDVHDFADNQRLCATQLSGGHPGANAGGYCHRILPLTTSERVVSFADDMTPRLDWTWDGAGGGSFFLAAAIRFHCWKNCLCADRTRKKNYVDPQLRMWEWLMTSLPDRDIIPTGKGNNYPLGSSTDAKGKPRTDSRGSNPPAAQCAANLGHDDSRCTSPWPIDILGPMPKHIQNLALPQPPSRVGWDSNKACGNDCSSNNDCGAECLCRLPSVEAAHTFGVDPVAPRALCLDITSVLSRSLETQKGADCLCNSTYIAPACCHSRDGMIQGIKPDRGPGQQREQTLSYGYMKIPPSMFPGERDAIVLTLDARASA